jgi:hypothetical protein
MSLAIEYSEEAVASTIAIFPTLIRASDRRDQSALFEALRLKVDRRSWRISPTFALRSQIKDLILLSYECGLISIWTAQRLIDLSQCWEG